MQISVGHARITSRLQIIQELIQFGGNRGDKHALNLNKIPDMSQCEVAAY